MFVSQNIQLVEKDGFRSLIAKDFFEPDQLILEFEQNFVAKPNNFTFRIDENLHQLSTDPNAWENYINHDCEPNGYIEFKNFSFVALRKIFPGEVLSYNYFTTDWDDEDVFTCHCQSKKCKKIINGFKNLSYQEMVKLEPYISPFLKRKMKELTLSRI